MLPEEWESHSAAYGKAPLALPVPAGFLLICTGKVKFARYKARSLGDFCTEGKPKEQGFVIFSQPQPSAL